MRIHVARALPDRRPVEFAHRDKATWMGWIAVAGGGTGLAFSTWLTRMTELAWPLHETLEQPADYFSATMSNSTFNSSFTFTVPPATVIGSIPKSRCFSAAVPRYRPSCRTTENVAGRVSP